MNFTAAYHTDVGIRKKTNQDSLAIKIVDTPKGQACLAIMCDGMGGLSKGELASKEVIYAYCDWFEKEFPRLAGGTTFNMSVLKDQWDYIAISMNEKLRTFGEELGIMLGTTISMVLFFQDNYYILHVGDSRVYEMTNGVSTQLTKDQTFVAREVAAGRMTEEQAKVDPRRSVLLQCIGASPSVHPDFVRGHIVPNTTYMLCSDGFRHKITDEEMMAEIGPQIATTEEALTKGCIYLTELVKMRNETDNITVLTIRTE